ncbi:MAG: DUF3987 domain-containing protein [Calothrix sp. FI2-JRJ7]|jgi:hypothetical protein|nr:DUF3987 domain-containing protein [Calothrix sp. FI2-JRJ7]
MNTNANSASSPDKANALPTKKFSIDISVSQAEEISKPDVITGNSNGIAENTAAKEEKTVNTYNAYDAVALIEGEDAEPLVINAVAKTEKVKLDVMASADNTEVFCVATNGLYINKSGETKLSEPGSFRTEEMCFADLARHHENGYPWMFSILDEDKPRRKQYANVAHILGLDFDGTITYQEYQEIEFVKDYCGLAMPSASSSPTQHKFRGVFRLPQPITADMGGYKFIESCLRYLVDNVFGGLADKQCVDANRFFFGAQGKKPFILDNTKKLPDNFFELVKENEERIALIIEQQKAERKERAERFRAANPDISPEDTVNLLRDALTYLPQRVKGSGNYPICLAVLMGLHHASTEVEIISEDDAIELIDEWSPTDPLEDWFPEKKWRGFNSSGANPTTIATIFWYAKQFGWTHPHKKEDEDTAKTEPETASETIERITETISDADNPQRVKDIVTSTMLGYDVYYDEPKADATKGTKDKEPGDIRQDLIDLFNSNVSGSDLDFKLTEISKKHRVHINNVRELYNSIELESTHIDTEALATSFDKYSKVGELDINLNNYVYTELAEHLSECYRDLGYNNLAALSFLLPVVASLIPIGTNIEAWEGYIQPAILWLAVIKISGGLKSPALTLVTQVIQKLEVKSRRRHEREIKKLLEQLGVKSLKQAYQKGLITPEDLPVKRRFWVTNPTMEALLKIQATQLDYVTFSNKETKSSGLLLEDEEISGFFAGLNGYKNGKGSDIENLLTIHGGGGVTHDRKTDDRNVFVSKSAINIVGTTQNDTLLEILDKYGEGGKDPRGLFSRFMWVISNDDPRKSFERKGSPKALKRELTRLYRRILANNPRLYTLTPAARTYFESFSDWTLDKAKDGSSLPGVKTYWGKVKGLVLRIALILHLINNTNNRLITPDDIAPSAIDEEIDKWLALDDDGYSDEDVIRDSAIPHYLISLDTIKKAVKLSLIYVEHAKKMFQLFNAQNMSGDEFSVAVASGSAVIIPVMHKILEMAESAKENGITTTNIQNAGIQAELRKPGGSQKIIKMFEQLEALGKGKLVVDGRKKTFYANEFIPK